jgi:competence protein ComEC
MTFVQPFALWDIGFQLSFAATLGLMLYSQPFSEWTRSRLVQVIEPGSARGIIELLADSFVITVAAQILTVPLVITYFERFSLISLPANALVLPVQPGVMVLGGLATLVGMLSPFVGQMLGWIAWPFIAYTTGLARWLASVPGATLQINLTSSGVLFLYALIASVTWLGRLGRDQVKALLTRLRPRLANRLALSTVVLLLVLTLSWGLTQPDGKLHVAFLDVGQGDAIFVQTPSGRQILVDGGKSPSVLNDELGRQMPFWDKAIDLVIATHPDADHVSGLPGVLKRYDVTRLVTDGEYPGESGLYDTLLTIAKEKGVQVHKATAGETIEIDDGVRMELLNPGPDPLFGSPNENSVSFRLVYGEFSMLLTGDAEEEAERLMLSNSQGVDGLPLVSLVLKAGHHGSRSSSNRFFLEAVRPQIVVISAGANNRYGHPHPEVLQRAQELGATVLRTDELGTIELSSDGQSIWLESAP